jgi:hypothetical protein
MASDQSKQPENLPSIDELNGSGFPFQMGVKSLIARTSEVHGWQTESEECHWSHDTANLSGFADLIVSHSRYIYTLVMECKKVARGGRYYFVPSEENAGDHSRVSTFCANEGYSDSPGYFGWCDFHFNAASVEAKYCVEGKSKNANLIENIADKLLPSVEALGIQHVRAVGTRKDWTGDWRLIVPVIVTNALLYVCKFDPATVDLETGRISEGQCKFTEAPMVRFRKNLTSHYPRIDSHAEGSSQLSIKSTAMDRTVLVMNANHLVDILAKLTVTKSFPNDLQRLHLRMMGERRK